MKFSKNNRIIDRRPLTKNSKYKKRKRSPIKKSIIFLGLQEYPKNNRFKQSRFLRKRY